MSRIPTEKADPDEPGLNDLFCELRPKLKSLINRQMSGVMRQRVDASDIVQDTLQEAVERLDDLKSKSSIPLEALLFKLAKQNTVDNYRRHVGAKQRSVLSETSLSEGEGDAFQVSEDSTGPLQQASNTETCSSLLAAIASLDEVNQNVIVARFFHEQPIKEIAEEMGVSADSVSKRLMRALKHLAVKLQNSGVNDLD